MGKSSNNNQLQQSISLYVQVTQIGVSNMAVENILAEPRSKVIPRTYYVFAHLHLPTNGHTIPMYQLPTNYGFRGITGTQFLEVKVTMARSKVKSWSDHAMHSQPMSLLSINLQHLTVSDVKPRHLPDHLLTQPDAMGDRNTCTAFKCCVVKTMLLKTNTSTS